MLYYLLDTQSLERACRSSRHDPSTKEPATAVATLTNILVTTLGSGGWGLIAAFNSPYGVAVDGAGVVYVTDPTNNALRKLTIVP